MKSLPSASLIIATYNWPAALELCLYSCLDQSVLPTEIIVADDGSTDDTKRLVEKIANISTVPIKHVWQEDLGFRLAEVRNKAISQAGSDYIIQIDGDLILHKDFIKDHLSVAKYNQFVSGHRSMLSPYTSSRLLASHSKSSDFRAYHFFDLTKKYYALRSWLLFAFTKFLQKSSKKYSHVLGANMAFWKDDLLEVNGYNQSMTGWGKEDNELAVRLINAGKNLLLVKNICLVYHLHHTEAKRERLDTNENILSKAIEEKVIRTKNGIAKE